MRGKVGHAGKNHVESGITPAYAGKSAGVRCSDADWQDHPRLCGEKLKQMFLDQINTGSPPPMRGKGQSRNF